MSFRCTTDRFPRQKILFLLGAMALPLAMIALYGWRHKHTNDNHESFPTNGIPKEDEYEEKQCSQTLQALEYLQSSFFNETAGSWSGGPLDPSRGPTDSGMIGWWNAANSLEVIVLALARLPLDCWQQWEGKRQWLLDDVIDSIFLHQNMSGIIGSLSFDDMGWVSLAWIRSYEVTGNVSYLLRAQKLWNFVQSMAWDEVCGGGLYWAGDAAGGGLRYKNAITNELFITSSMRLYRHTDPSGSSEADMYLRWAQRTWDWFRTCGMIVNEGSYVAGGLADNCQTDYSEGYTYNQGVILGGLGMLYSETPVADQEKRAELINAAETIASAVALRDEDESGSSNSNRWLDKNGVLLEPCVPDLSSCNSDQAQFKGIFCRYLRYYLDEVGDASPRRKEYEEFLQRNAQAVWKNARRSPSTLGLRWDGPPPELDAPFAAITQTSGLDVLLAAL